MLAAIAKDIAHHGMMRPSRRNVSVSNPRDVRRLPLVEDQSPLNATEDRRRFLQSCGRFAVTVPPAITILLSTSLSSAAIAASSGGGGGGHGPKGNNGVGNGPDPQPPGNPPINDGPGTGPGNPGNKHHGKK